MKDKDNTRRGFLKKGLTLGAFSASAMAMAAFKDDEVMASGETVKLLSPEGEIVEIDKAY